MKGNVNPSKGGKDIFAPAAQVVHTNQHQVTPYLKVLDERKRPIRGLWVRNGRYWSLRPRGMSAKTGSPT